MKEKHYGWTIGIGRDVIYLLLLAYRKQNSLGFFKGRLAYFLDPGNTSLSQLFQQLNTPFVQKLSSKVKKFTVIILISVCRKTLSSWTVK